MVGVLAPSLLGVLAPLVLRESLLRWLFWSESVVVLKLIYKKLVIKVSERTYSLILYWVFKWNADGSFIFSRSTIIANKLSSWLLLQSPRMLSTAAWTTSSKHRRRNHVNCLLLVLSWNWRQTSGLALPSNQVVSRRDIVLVATAADLGCRSDAASQVRRGSSDCSRAAHIEVVIILLIVGLSWVASRVVALNLVLTGWRWRYLVWKRGTSRSTGTNCLRISIVSRILNLVNLLIAALRVQTKGCWATVEVHNISFIVVCSVDHTRVSTLSRPSMWLRSWSLTCGRHKVVRCTWSRYHLRRLSLVQVTCRSKQVPGELWRLLSLRTTALRARRHVIVHNLLDCLRIVILTPIVQCDPKPTVIVLLFSLLAQTNRFWLMLLVQRRVMRVRDDNFFTDWSAWHILRLLLLIVFLLATSIWSALRSATVVWVHLVRIIVGLRVPVIHATSACILILLINSVLPILSIAPVVVSSRVLSVIRSAARLLILLSISSPISSVSLFAWTCFSSCASRARNEAFWFFVIVLLSLSYSASHALSTWGASAILLLVVLLNLVRHVTVRESVLDLTSVFGLVFRTLRRNGARTHVQLTPWVPVHGLGINIARSSPWYPLI